MNLVEVHVIQSVAPSNLNRDDTGSPKDAIFGGVRRARVSSQAQKRAVRDYFRELLADANLLQPDDLALRTRRLVESLVDHLRQRRRSADEAQAVVRAALGGLGFEVGDRGLTQYLVFLGRREILGLADAIERHWDTLAEVAGAAGALEEPKGRARKKAARAAVPSEVSHAMEAILDGGKAVDLALFGRMLADRPEWAVDAAAQVAHALSTHQVEREFDFYTAVDDLNPREEAGVGMMGDIEFYSACLYRYANVHLEQLAHNLQDDRELAARAVESFLKAFPLTLPSGKQNSFAAHNPPGFIALVVREGGLPRNLVGAFERPVTPRDGKSLSGVSVEALLAGWERLDQAFGRASREWVSLLNLTDGEIRYHRDAVRTTFDDALGAAMEGVRSLLKVG